VYETPVTQNRNVTTSLSWTGIATRNLVSLFTLFGPTKFISSSKRIGDFRVNVLNRQLNYWKYKSANKPVPMYTDVYMCNSVCHQRLSHRSLLVDNIRYTYTKAELATCNDDIFPPGAANIGGWEPAAVSPECSPSYPNLNLGAGRSPCDHVTLLRSAEHSSEYPV
jgi:hypothetical protein